MIDKSLRQNRIRAALDRIYENQPPHFRDLLRRYQEDPTSRVFAPLADLYRQMGRYEEAVELCLQGLNHHPQFQAGRVTLARCYFDEKRYSEARDALEIAIKKHALEKQQRSTIERLTTTMAAIGKV